jgi:hypothetical protein
MDSQTAAIARQAVGTAPVPHIADVAACDGAVYWRVGEAVFLQGKAAAASLALDGRATCAEGTAVFGAGAFDEHEVVE